MRSNPAVLDAYLGGEDDAGDADASSPRRRRRHARCPSTAGPATPGEPGSAGPTAADASRGVIAGYGGGDILKQVSLDVPEGGITCIVGPNGAGKSTLLATISGLLRPRQGEIRFGGEVDLRALAAPDPGPRDRASPAGAQPVPAT